jgi:hypothetical protein
MPSAIGGMVFTPLTSLALFAADTAAAASAPSPPPAVKRTADDGSDEMRRPADDERRTPGGGIGDIASRTTQRSRSAQPSVLRATRSRALQSVPRRDSVSRILPQGLSLQRRNCERAYASVPPVSCRALSRFSNFQNKSFHLLQTRTCETKAAK